MLYIDLEYRNKLRAILKHFGLKAQFKKFLEEQSELVSAWKCYRGYDEICEYSDFYNLKEETADCVVVALQLGIIKEFKRFYKQNINYKFNSRHSYEMRLIIQMKIDRTIYRYKIPYKKVGD